MLLGYLSYGNTVIFDAIQYLLFYVCRYDGFTFWHNAWSISQVGKSCLKFGVPVRKNIVMPRTSLLIKNSFSMRNYRLLCKKRIIGSNSPTSGSNSIWNWQTTEQMKKNFICSKKSVRTFKLRIEPYFLSHAERGKPFWILDSAGGMHQCAESGGAPPFSVFFFAPLFAAAVG